jgi:hypothetical protein
LCPETQWNRAKNVEFCGSDDGGAYQIDSRDWTLIHGLNMGTELLVQSAKMTLGSAPNMVTHSHASTDFG